MTGPQPGPPSQADDQDLLAAWFDEFVDDVLDGRATDLDDYIERRPDLAGDLEDLLRRAHELAGRRPPTELRVAGYDIVREIGRGGMGAVYLAVREVDGEVVALKILPSTYGLSDRARARFLREARALSAVDSQHVVRIHDILSDDTGLAISMEYVDGPTLADVCRLLSRRGTQATLSDLRDTQVDIADLPEGLTLVQWCVRITAQLARALEAVHRAGLVHRDVKPGNVLLRRDGSPLLADFGLVRDLASSATRTEVFVGTLDYAPPEQLRSGDEAADARADIYSLGVTLWELVVGTPPYSSRTVHEAVAAIERSGPPWLRRAAPRAPRDLETILLRALDPDPAARYPTAVAFAEDLEQLLRWRPIRTRRPGLLWRARRRLRRHGRLMTAGLIGAGLLAVALGLGLGMRYRAQRQIDRAVASVEAARRDLVSRPVRQRAYQQIVLGRSPQFLRLESGFGVESSGLAASSEQLRGAAAVLDDTARLRTESLMVAIAAGLGPAGLGVGEPPDSELDLSALSEPVRRYAAPWASGELNRALGPVDLSGATVADREAIGLLAFLSGDVRNCEAAWAGLDPVSTEVPLPDAGLGLLYALDERPERAYPRLLQAVRRLEGEPLLAVTLAEVAAQLGDVEIAARWLERAERLAADPVDLVVARADLALARGQASTAVALLAAVDTEEPRVVLRRARAARLNGDPAAALRLARQLVDRQRWMMRARLELARSAVMLRDAAAYLEQVDWVLAHGFAANRSPGTRRDVIDLLRLGGLRGIAELAMRSFGDPPPAGRDAGPLGVPLFSDVDAVEHLVLSRRGYRADPLRRAAARTGTAALRGLADLAAVVTWLPEACAWVPSRPRFVAVAAALGVRLGWRPLAARLQPLLSLADDDRPVDGLASRCIVGGEAGLRVGLVEPLDDVDGDGHVDLILGSFRDPENGPGTVTVHSGKTGGLLREYRGLSVGNSAARVGDLDGDGTQDFAYAELLTDGAAAPVAVVRLVSGRSGASLGTLRSPTSSETFGNALVGVDDLDGDGAPEIAVGDMGTSGGIGVVRIYSAHRAEPLVVFHGPRAASFGLRIAPIQDRDGDGARDLLVSGPAARGARGAVWVVSTRTGRGLVETLGESGARLHGINLIAGIDLDEDGVGDYAVSEISRSGLGAMVIRSGVDDRDLCRWEDAGLTIQQSLVFGDFDGDGVADLAAGAPLGDRGDRDDRSAGAVSIWSGRSLRGGSPRRLLRVYGSQAGDEFGATLASLPPRGVAGRELLCIAAPGAGDEEQGGVWIVGLAP